MKHIILAALVGVLLMALPLAAQNPGDEKNKEQNLECASKYFRFSYLYSGNRLTEYAPLQGKSEFSLENKDGKFMVFVSRYGRFISEFSESSKWTIEAFKNGYGVYEVKVVLDRVNLGIVRTEELVGYGLKGDSPHAQLSSPPFKVMEFVEQNYKPLLFADENEKKEEIRADIRGSLVSMSESLNCEFMKKKI